MPEIRCFDAFSTADFLPSPIKRKPNYFRLPACVQIARILDATHT